MGPCLKNKKDQQDSSVGIGSCHRAWQPEFSPQNMVVKGEYQIFKQFPNPYTHYDTHMPLYTYTH